MAPTLLPATVAEPEQHMGWAVVQRPRLDGERRVGRQLERAADCRQRFVETAQLVDQPELGRRRTRPHPSLGKLLHPLLRQSGARRRPGG